MAVLLPLLRNAVLFGNREHLHQSLRLAHPPVAVGLVDHIPGGVESWSGHSPAGWRFWQEAAHRVCATAAAHHSVCSIGQYTHGLDMSPASNTDLMAALKVFADLTYVREQDVQAIPVLTSKPKYVVYGPLAEIPVNPDVVLLFVRADQTLILSELRSNWKAGCRRPWGARPERSSHKLKTPAVRP